MAGMLELSDIKCFNCRHPHGRHDPEGRCRASVGDYGTCLCRAWMDPNMLILSAKEDTMSSQVQSYQTALRRTQATAAQKRGRLAPVMTAGWTGSWILSFLAFMLAIWTPTGEKFVWSAIVLFVGGAACAITRAFLYNMNKGAIIDAHDHL